MNDYNKADVLTIQNLCFDTTNISKNKRLLSNHKSNEVQK